MCSSKASFFAVVLAVLAIGEAAAQTVILTTPKKPFAFAGGAATSPDDKVWSAVVLASNCKKGDRPLVAPPDLAPFAPRLSKLFGCSQFEVLGSAILTMDDHTERWLVPTKNFWVSARATRERGGYRLKMEFFHDARRLLEAEAMLGPKSPLFITGPMHARGQIIFVFEIKP